MKNMISIVPKPVKMQETGGTVPSSAETVCAMDESLPEEAYRISIRNDRITITAGSEKGLNYGKATMKQVRLQCPESIPCMEIEDAPAYPYRSFHMDCARHFFTVEEVKKMIDTASLFKLNSFHWHISDDQGFRIESEAFPRLQEISAKRKGDHFGKFSSDPEEHYYYKRTEVKDLVSYAAERGVDIVPEIDMPGHVTAILAAYPELSCTGAAVEVGTRQGIFPDIFCPGKEETFDFIERLWDDLLPLFPGKYIHIGGDESPKDRWQTCPACKKRMEEEGLKIFQELQGYMENRIAKHLEAKGKQVICWNEAAYGKNLENNVNIQMWTEDREESIKAHIARGGHIILSTMMNSYCDYPYGFISLKSLYGQLEAGDRFGQEYMDAAIGTECLCWAEFINTPEHLEEMAWPRFAASAECGWSGKNGHDYKDFKRRLTDVFPLFEAQNINAAPPADWEPGKLKTLGQIKDFFGNFTKEEIDAMKAASKRV